MQHQFQHSVQHLLQHPKSSPFISNVHLPHPTSSCLQILGDTDVDDENERDEEDDRDDAIDTDEIHLPNDDENCCQTENIDLVMVQQVVECESTRFVNLKLVIEMTITVAAIQAVVAEQFELPRFFLALEQSNPGCIMYSKMVLGNNPNEEIFQRVFWAFAPSIKGFAHCRPVLSIDGTHLYGKYKGTLLIAMGCDGNNQLFPLAFAMTEGENTNSWSWLLACIRVGVTQRKGLRLISDRHPGIIAAVNETYSGWTQPDACHRFCMRHLASNFNTKFKDKTLKDLMCRAAMESKVKKLISHMDTIGRINAEARNWLEQIPLEKWALSYDGGRRYGIMTTNMSEVFNGVLKGARNLPITTLVQLTFYRVNSYFTVRREHGANRLASGEEFTPHIDAKIKAKVVKAGAHEVLLYDHVAGRFHVKTRHSVGSSNRKPRTYHVTLQTGSCTCNKTLLLGFPCLHILAACHCRAIDFRQFVQGYYTTHAYLSTWAPLFYPIFDELEWPQYNGPIIVPSDSMKRLTSGRPKSSLLHNEMDARETRTPQTCGLCKQSGHNRHSCPNVNNLSLNISFESTMPSWALDDGPKAREANNQWVWSIRQEGIKGLWLVSFVISHHFKRTEPLSLPLPLPERIQRKVVPSISLRIRTVFKYTHGFRAFVGSMRNNHNGGTISGVVQASLEVLERATQGAAGVHGLRTGGARFRRAGDALRERRVLSTSFWGASDAVPV
ncbi:hypothetical protein CK203_064579 [Vitis vinifera]|uniref:SWIM-type domain-containing protein n=1 Tax=Vitis vinifera TaxID=29760 RepID=A0A438G799_VITVI|nr:hypothetical protein CK203_064579 [Vitis vinifera]